MINKLKTADFEINGRGMISTIKMSARFNDRLEEITRQIQEGMRDGSLKSTPQSEKDLRELIKINERGRNIENKLTYSTIDKEWVLTKRLKYYYAALVIVGKLLVSAFSLGVTLVISNKLMSLEYGGFAAILLIFVILTILYTIWGIVKNWNETKDQLLVAKYRDANVYRKSLEKVINKTNAILSRFEKGEDSDKLISSVNKELAAA